MTKNQSKLSELQLAVTAAALDGDSSAIYHKVRELLGEGMPFDRVLFDVIAPVQSALGARWQVGDYVIAEEHIATNAIETVIALLAGSFEQPDEALHVAVASVQGDTHSLGGRMIVAHLLSEGFRTSNLGSTMPAADLEAYLADLSPDALVLTCSMVNHLPGARASIAAGHNSGVPVLVGGPAFGNQGERAARLGADGWVPQLVDVAKELRTWNPDPVQAAATAAEPSEELLALISSRPVVVANAAAELAGRVAGSGDRAEEAGFLFDALTAALTLDDRDILQHQAEWMISHLEHRHGASPTTSMHLRALGSSIDSQHQSARQWLDAVAAALEPA